MDLNNMVPNGNKSIYLDVDELMGRNHAAYLFFDIELGQNSEFTRLAVEVASGCQFALCSFDVCSAQSGEVLERYLAGSDPSSILISMQRMVDDGEIALGLLLVDRNGAWYIVQENPVSLGIVGLSEECLLRAPAVILEENFVSCMQIAGWGPEKVRQFDLVYGSGRHSWILRKYCRQPSGL